MRGILTGPVEDLATEARARINDRIALTMSQSIMYGFKSDRQMNYKPGWPVVTDHHRMNACTRSHSGDGVVPLQDKLCSQKMFMCCCEPALY